MMKKIIAILTVICMLAVCASCGNASTPDDTQTNTGVSPNVKTVFGEITEVAGNMLNIKLAKMPEGRVFGNGPGEREMNPEMRKAIDDLQEGESKEITLPDGSKGFVSKSGGDEGGGNLVTIGGAPDGVEVQGPDGNAPKTVTRGNMNGNATINLEYTGEEIEFIIPVGIPVLQQSIGQSGMEEKEISLDKLKAGYIITIIYKEDGVTIDKIMISMATAAKAEQ